jgi:cysteine desulfurase/selenocysteine lyase
MAAYDLAAVRADFPILATTVYGHPLTYLDNGASAQKPKAVIERMVRLMESEYANVHRGLHYLANASTEAYEGARETVRRFVNAASSDEIVFTKSITEAINLVATSLGQSIEAGDEIVLSILEHHSNIVPWHFLRERKGAVIKWAPVADDGSFLLEEYVKLLGPRTKVVAITQMSNVTGTVTPVAEIVAAAHAVGAKVFVDGAQGAVHLPIDVQALDVDFYGITGHKLYGPTGIGALYGKRDLLAAMPPYLGGGEMIRDVTEDRVTYGEPPYRFEAGTPPIVEAAGLAAALDYIEGLGRAAIAAHEAELRDYAMARLKEINSLTIYGEAPNKGAIVAFNLAGAHAHDVATVLDRYGIAVRAGSHCAQPLLARYGQVATCRASFALYNTVDEIDRLVDGLRKAQSFFG